MKKILILFIIMLFLVCLNYIFNTSNDKREIKKESINKQEIRGVFVSYIDYNSYFKNKTDEELKKNIDTIVKNVSDMKFNLIILQVRSFSDAIYKSSIYPLSNNLDSNSNIDILNYFIKVAHKNNIKLHAWVNPYRISTSTSLNLIESDNPAYKWIGTNNIKVIENKGIYYNPATKEVNELIISGIKEIVDNYQIDGICFDDYFYPSNNIDKVEYETYLKTNNYLTLEDYHLMNINNMVRDVYSTVKNKNKNILFGISPDGNIDNDYNTNFADVKRWAKEEGYVDYLMPQIYYGFLNESKPYIDTSLEWNNLMVNKKVKFILALGIYKSGDVDIYAKNGSNEWIDNNDIIKKQIIISRNLSNYDGFSIFRYDYFFNDKLKSDQVVKEIENIKEVVE